MTQAVTYTHGKLLLSIVARGHGETLVAITKSAGARGGTILPGRGTADSAILDFLGLGDSEKDICLTILGEEQVTPVLEALGTCRLHERRKTGICMVIDVPHFLVHITRNTPLPAEKRQEPMNSPHTLITFIVNRGFADDAMAAARRAGARGGTIMHARGTGKEEDVQFFGIQLVPEKEILVILVESGQAPAILEAVKAVPCLAEPGSGIAYCTPVEHHIVLGRK